MSTTAAATENRRPPGVVGRFYEADTAVLSATVDRLMAASTALQDTAIGAAPHPKAIIVPHAAHRFSGSVAASAYARIVPIADRITRVVMFGPAHRVRLRGLAIPSHSAFATPLGNVPLDRDNLELLRAQPYTRVSDEAHAGEHCLEVQLPFLQKILGDFRLTPVVAGGADSEHVADALRRTWGGPETLIVISSDLSHYHTYEEALRRDGETSRLIMLRSVDRIRSQNACGWRPVNGLLQLTMELGLVPATLDVRNSGDTLSGHDRVVGYGAWAFTAESDPSYLPLTDDMQNELLRVAAATVRRAATGTALPKVSVGTFADVLQRPGASFVTLTRNGELRGCLGSLHAYRPLVMDVAERGYATACRDPRFPALRPAELRGLHLEVAVLTPPAAMEFTDQDDLLRQLQPGTDGLIIEDGKQRATFLPKVWDQIPEPARFLARLKQKAGLDPAHWSAGFRAWRYGTRRFGMAFPAPR